MRLTPQLSKPGLEIAPADLGLALEATRQAQSPALSQSPPPQALQDQAHSQLAPRLQGHYSADDTARISYAAAQVAHQEAYKGQPEGFYVTQQIGPNEAGLAIKYPHHITELRMAELLQQTAPGHLGAHNKKHSHSAAPESLAYPKTLPRGHNSPGVLLADASQYTNSHHDPMTGLPLSPNNSWTQGQGSDSRVGDAWKWLTKPVDKLVALKQQSLLPLEQNTQGMQNYRNEPQTGFWGKWAADLTIAQMARARGATQAFVPETRLDMGLSLAPALPKLSGATGGVIKGVVQATEKQVVLGSAKAAENTLLRSGGQLDKAGNPLLDMGKLPRDQKRVMGEQLFGPDTVRQIVPDGTQIARQQSQGVTGIDELYKVNRADVDYVSIEYKFVGQDRKTGAQVLGKTEDGRQGSLSWLQGSGRIEKAVGSRSQADAVRDAIKQNRVESWVVTTRPDGSTLVEVLDALGKPKPIDTSRVIRPSVNLSGAQP